ncbi:MAG TPA: nitrogenase component 1, partial [Myxococcota bacterium]|nr:nitrogenase component 1 [Myxococcota bacterium]
MSDRELARLNQTVCGLEGMASLLARTPGDFAVVIHGPADCAGLLLQGMDQPGSERFFCTHLEEADLVSGRAGQRLGRCLEVVSRELAPGVVFVLGTCGSALIGDDLKGALAKAARATPVPLISPHAGGMGWISQSALLDRFGLLMLEACAARPQERTPRCVNLIGFEPGAELRRVLSGQALEVNAVLGPGAAWSDWARMGRASHNLSIDPELFGGTLAQAERRLGQRTLCVPAPVGFAGSLAFLAALEAEWPAPGDHPWPRPSPPALLATARARLSGRRLGYNVGSTKNLEARTLALEGLGDLAAFQELGLEVVLLVQGDDRPARLEAVRRTLSRLG